MLDYRSVSWWSLILGGWATSIHAKTELPRLGSAMGKVGLSTKTKKTRMELADLVDFGGLL